MNKIIRICVLLMAFTWYTTNAQQLKVIHSPPAIRASFYAPKFEGRLMANGQRYHSSVISAASRAFPLGTVVRVRNVHTGKTVVMKITDRGPWHTRFRLDLSFAAFHALGFKRKDGWGQVTVEAVKSVEDRGSDKGAITVRRTR